jgi:hypothetical protein
MFKTRSVLVSLIIAFIVTACASLGLMVTCKNAAAETSRGLVGAWLVSASRPSGEGVVLLTFTSDGTFFRSGDTHPVLSVGHGVWKRNSDREFDATYIALRFDENRKLVGSQKTRIRITVGPGENEFTGLAKVSSLDLKGNEERASETRLKGKRIQVEPF